ncbi:MAG: rhomboid family intramembrane serine protease [Bacteroidales bacterium]|nr:rhomboid family intramembrane serine protease [Bacteroidales bacterium]
MLKTIPPVVKNLLLINVVVYVLSIVLSYTTQIDLADYLGLYFFKSEFFQPYQYVSYMFMHAYINPNGSIVLFHILFNMFALWMFGRVLEQVWGPKKFFMFYIITGLGAAVTHTFVQWWQYQNMHEAALIFANSPSPEQFEIFVKEYFPAIYKQLFDFIAQWTQSPSHPEFMQQATIYVQQLEQLQVNVPVVGASGAVFGILLAFGMMFPNTKLMLLFPPIPLKAKYFVLIYGALELFLGISGGTGDNVAHFAHLGGMVFGFILLMIWRVRPTDQY